MSTGIDDAHAGPSAQDGAADPVKAALHALDSADITYALLRGAPEPGHAGDVDVLVAATDLDRADAILTARGWLPAPSAGHGTHRFYTLYDSGSRDWYQLDVVTSLDFGPLLGYRTGLAAAVLARRVREQGLATLRPDDAFWLLLMHHTWKQESEERWARLRTQARAAEVDGPVAGFLVSVGMGPDAALARLLEAARADDRDRVRRAQLALKQHWSRRDRWGIAGTQAANWALRRLSVGRGAGTSLALLGLDGAGKTTTAARLKADLPWPTVSLYMGVWRQSTLDRVVRKVVGAQLLLRLGRLSRLALLTRYHRALGRVVLLDRFIVDATLPSPDLDWKGRFSSALVLRTASAPDRMVFLDAPAEVVFARKGELTIEELERRREHYREMQPQFPQWVTVEADQPLDEVLAELNEMLWADLRRSRADAS